MAHWAMGISFAVLGVTGLIITFGKSLLLPLIGYNHGAGKTARVVEVILKTGLASVAWTGLCWAAVMLFDKATPGDFWKEILEKQNTAVAILMGALAIGSGTPPASR